MTTASIYRDGLRRHGGENEEAQVLTKHLLASGENKKVMDQ
jgi:hypothetical protein